jgi:hypothetical protein
VADITWGFFENQASGRTSGANGILPELLGIPLAPGWLLTRGTFEKAGNLSSLNQIVGPAFLVPLISGLIDTGVMFGAWGVYSLEDCSSIGFRQHIAYLSR